MPQQNIELLRRGFERLVATGEPLWDTVHEEVEVHDHDILDAGEYRGHAGLRRWLEDWGAAWAEYGFEPQEFIEAGDSVVVIIRVKAKGLGSGVEVERQDGLVYSFRDGRIVRLDYYNSRHQAREAVGPASEKWSRAN
jgi:ketosteroid isomerase-like protein